MHYNSAAHAVGPVVVVAVLVVSAVGCGGSKFKLADVEGRVVLDGEPVSGAKVVFMPATFNDEGESGPYSQGVTDAEGHYHLKTQDEEGRRGAVIGRHRVIVSTKRARLDPDAMDREIIDVPESIPRKYTHHKETPLTFEVPLDGADNADFALETPTRKR